MFQNQPALYGHWIGQWWYEPQLYKTNSQLPLNLTTNVEPLSDWYLESVYIDKQKVINLLGVIYKVT